jgi:hypothetical protein
MRHLAKIHVVLVAAAVVFGTLNASHMPHPDSPARNAGCHEHQNAPAQVPVSYDCCQNGHGLALVRTADTGPRDFAISTLLALSFEPAPVSDAIHSPSAFERDTGEPPGLLPLRI